MHDRARHESGRRACLVVVVAMIVSTPSVNDTTVLELVW
jgi:hypothetical protein